MTRRSLGHSQRNKAGHRTWSAGNKPVKGKHRGDIMPPETRSRLMSRIKGKGTKPEMAIMTGLQNQGLVFETHARDLPGRPDIVFRPERLAVFVDGDFWHGWRFPLWKHKLSEKWQNKIATTRSRDQRNFRKLRREGWKVIRVWEHQVESNVDSCIEKIIARLDQVRPEPQPLSRKA